MNYILDKSVVQKYLKTGKEKNQNNLLSPPRSCRWLLKEMRSTQVTHFDTFHITISKLYTLHCFAIKKTCYNRTWVYNTWCENWLLLEKFKWLCNRFRFTMVSICRKNESEWSLGDAWAQGSAKVIYIKYWMYIILINLETFYWSWYDGYGYGSSLKTLHCYQRLND